MYNPMLLSSSSLRRISVCGGLHVREDHKYDHQAMGSEEIAVHSFRWEGLYVYTCYEIEFVFIGAAACYSSVLCTYICM